MKERECSTNYSDYYLEIKTNCLPNYEIELESYEPKNILNFKIPTETSLDPTGFWGPYNLIKKNFLPSGPIGVCINGVPFFSQEIDNNYTIPHINYFYNQLPLDVSVFSNEDTFSDLNQLFRHQLKSQEHSQIIGFSFDGFPIYGPIGWDSHKKVKIMSSSYQDKEYIENSGDLDVCNGVFGPTPDYPNGIYHYHASIMKDKDGFPDLHEGQVISMYPHLIGRYRGTPEIRNFIEVSD